jgi:hypothetical protein
MILLRHDCLVFRTADGDIPCSAEEVTVELLGDSAQLVEPHIIKNAALAVLHYFKSELGRTTVSVGEFSQALEATLRALGLNVVANSPPPSAVRVIEADLGHLVHRGGQGLELMFFQSLRQELRHQLAKSPQILRFRGLRGCVQQIVGSKRWNHRCQRLHDQVVDYLRTCLGADRSRAGRALLVLT